MHCNFTGAERAFQVICRDGSTFQCTKAAVDNVNICLDFSGYYVDKNSCPEMIMVVFLSFLVNLNVQ